MRAYELLLTILYALVLATQYESPYNLIAEQAYIFQMGPRIQIAPRPQHHVLYKEREGGRILIAAAGEPAVFMPI